jgi:hypothetical protein
MGNLIFKILCLKVDIKAKSTFFAETPDFQLKNLTTAKGTLPTQEISGIFRTTKERYLIPT